MAADAPVTSPPQALFEDFSLDMQGYSCRFERLERVVSATDAGDLPRLLDEVERGVTSGLHAAGFVCYEAAAGLDPALTTHPCGQQLPLARFALFAERIPVVPGALSAEGPCRILQPFATWDATTYAAAFAAVKEYIAAGDSYQVNLSFRQQFRFAGDPFTLYRKLCRAQPAAFCAWLDLGDMAIASASPELFFARRGENILMRPMKGTAPRGTSDDEDRRLCEHLTGSAKERAENLMIVDLVRNDLGRIATTGSVAVPELFRVESLPTLHQMTSTVTAKLKPGTGLGDIFRTLFPCGSVTGAPKRRSMAIIHEQETGPRGLYCGAVGFVSPGEEMIFSVAIRTTTLNVRKGEGTLGVGSGITADAQVDAEYRECQEKAAFLSRQAEPWQLVETLRWTSGQGFLLLPQHLKRLAASAGKLGFPFDLAEVVRQLQAKAAALHATSKVRLLLSTDGTITVSAEPLPVQPPSATPARVVLSAESIDPGEPLLYHKTTWRPWYDGLLERQTDCLDVLFCNTFGEVTEGTRHNLIVEKAGRLVTPPVSCGLLPGTLRDELLAQGILKEELISKEELLAAPRLWLINSVRGWRRVTLV